MLALEKSEADFYDPVNIQIFMTFANQAAAAMEKFNEAFASTDPSVEVINWRELVPFLPDPQEGWSAEEPRGQTNEFANISVSLASREYTKGKDTEEAVGLSVEITDTVKYSIMLMPWKMAGMMRGEAAKQLCANLVSEELRHKKRLETLYDRLFYGEN